MEWIPWWPPFFHTSAKRRAWEDSEGEDVVPMLPTSRQPYGSYLPRNVWRKHSHLCWVSNEVPTSVTTSPSIFTSLPPPSSSTLLANFFHTTANGKGTRPQPSSRWPYARSFRFKNESLFLIGATPPMNWQVWHPFFSSFSSWTL